MSIATAIRDWWNTESTIKPELNLDVRIPEHAAANLGPAVCGVVMPGSTYFSGWLCNLDRDHGGLHSWQADYGLELRQLRPHQDVYAWLPGECRWVLATSIPGDEPYPLYQTESLTDIHLPGECEHHRPNAEAT